MMRMSTATTIAHNGEHGSVQPTTGALWDDLRKVQLLGT